MNDQVIVAQLKIALGTTTKNDGYDEQGHLISLDLSESGITQLPIEIGQLANLQILNLHHNRLTQVPSELGQLTNLQYLYLDHNQLVEVPRELGQLTNLQWLSLHRNRLTQVPGELGQLTNLQMLSLSSNQLSQVPKELGQLTNLQILYLHDNQLSQVPRELGQLTNLQRLDLDTNRLLEIPKEFGRLTHMDELNLHHNQLSQVPKELGQLMNVRSLRLDENPQLLTPPPEIVGKGTLETVTFLRELQLGSVARYEAKLLLVGEGGTGKSSLLRALHGKLFDAQLATTHGIAVDSLSLPHPQLPEQPLLLNTWDFGGQEIYRATHQFFLTRRSLYLVVWNARLGAIQSKLDYWLDTIRVLAPDAPVLLVATYIDECRPELNVRQYYKAYPQIVGTLSVSNKTNEGIKALKQMLTHHAAALPLMGQTWPLSWVAVEQALLACPDHHIDDRVYIDLCTDEGVQAEMAQGTLGGYLHDLGKMLYFLDDPILKSIVVLKPNWITKAISLVLEDPVTRKAEGILEHADLARIWCVDEDGHPYAKLLYPIFLRLMERFDLSYQINPMIPGQFPIQSLVPQLLPHEEPPAVKQVWPTDTTTPGQMHVKMVYCFDFVPAGIMSWFIVRTHHYTRNLHWRDGAILAYEGNVARVELFPMLRELRIAVRGIEPHTFFVILKETLDLILARFEGLRVRREVPCICQRQTQATTPCHEIYRYEEDLVWHFQNKQRTIRCRASFEEVSVVELLYGIHSITTPQVLANVEAGNREILQQLNTLLQKDDLLLQKVGQLGEWIVRGFTRIWNLEMHRLEAECPNTFFLIPDRRTSFNPKRWISHQYTLLLVCQHPPSPHIVDEEHGYKLDVPREWWATIAPWLKYLTIFLKIGIPLGDALGDLVDATDFKAIENQLKLLEEITKDLPGVVVERDPFSAIEKDFLVGLEEPIGAALRVLHSFLDEVDKHHYWGGLQRVVTPDGNILWLCGKHAIPYEALPLQFI